MNKIKILKLVSSLILCLFVSFLLLGFVFLNISDKEVNSIKTSMLKEGKTIELFVEEEYVKTLPNPVQRYFNFVFKEKKKISLKAISWKEEGKFTLPKLGTFSMSAWQVSLMDDIHYLWRGYMKQYFGLMTLESRDYFSFSSHDMRAKLFGLKKIMHSDYKSKEDLASLYEYLTLRYYGTALNFPWLLFSKENVKWQSLDKNRAYLIVKTKNKKAKFLVFFKDDGRIWKMQTLKYNLHGNYENLKETALKSEYINWKGLMVPSKMKYIWKDKNENTTIYEFKIKELEMIK